MGIGIWISYRYKITAKRQQDILIAIQTKNRDLETFKDIL
jgi:hypothetical protein